MPDNEPETSLGQQESSEPGLVSDQIDRRAKEGESRTGAIRANRRLAMGLAALLALTTGGIAINQAQRQEEAATPSSPTIDTLRSPLPDIDSSESTTERVTGIDDLFLAFEATNLSNEHNINIVNRFRKEDGEGLRSDDLKTVSSIFKLFPIENLRGSNSDDRVTIIFGDPTEEEQEDVNTVALSKNDLISPILSDEEFISTHDPEYVKTFIKNYPETLEAVQRIAEGIARRVDAQSGHELSRKMVEILGGEEFLRDPERMYPRLFELQQGDPIPIYHDHSFLTEDRKLRPPEEVFAIIAGYYLQNYDDYNTQQFLFDPRDYYPEGISLDEFERLERESTGYKVFRHVGHAVFGEKISFHSAYEEIPQITGRDWNEQYN